MQVNPPFCTLVTLLSVLCACSEPPATLLRRAPAGGLPWAANTYGGALGDLDGDGDLDLVFSPHGSHVVLFRNKGGLHFQEYPLSNPPPGLQDHHASAPCDFDSDGDLDLFLTVGARRGKGVPQGEGAGNHLWEQVSPMVFRNLATGTELADRGGRGRGALWVQLDASAAPEILLLNYASRPRLFRYDGTQWQDKTKQLTRGMAPDVNTSQLLAPLFVAAASDFDLDGDTDLFVDGNNRGLLRNDGEGALRNVLAQSGMIFQRAVAHAAAGDIDNDGDDDLILSHNKGEPVAVWINESTREELRFHEGPDLSALPLSTRQHAAMLGDLDNDGILDLYVVQRELERSNAPNFAARGLGDGQFEWMPSWGGEADVTGLPFGAWPADLDGDGDLDVLAFHGDEWREGDEGTVLVYENTSTAGGLTVELVSASSSAHGLGAQLHLDLGDATLVRQVQSSNNRFAASILPVHFGLGRRKGPFPLTIRWPDGEIQQLVLPHPRQAYRIRQGNAAAEAQ